MTPKRRLRILLGMTFVTLVGMLALSTVILPALGASYHRDVSGWTANEDINAGDDVTFAFGNGVNYIVTAQVFTRVQLTIDRQLSALQFGIVAKGTQNVQLTIQGDRNGPTSGIGPGQDITAGPGGKQYRYSYGMVIRVQTNLSVAGVDTFTLQATIPAGRSASNFHWAVYNQSTETFDLLDTTVVGSLVTAEISSTTFEVVLLDEEVFSWLWVVVMVVVAIFLVFGAVMSKTEYRQWVIQRFSRHQVGIHRLSIEDVLENETRSKIIDFVLDQPGCNFNQIREATGLQAGAATWHLELLLQYGVIRRVESGQFHLYFPLYMKNPIEALDLHLVKSETTLAILEFIAKHPASKQDVIGHAVGKDVRTVRYHLKKLQDAHLVAVTDDHRHKIYTINDTTRATNLLNHANHAPGGVP
jgi:predicted transcriptional regulator